MKNLLSFAGVATAAAALLLSSTAVAQPYGQPPPPPAGGGGGGGQYGPPPGPGYGPPAPRARRIGFGGGVGLGFMENRYDDLACVDCDYEPIAASVHGYFGFFLNPQLMLLAEVDGSGQRLDAVGSNFLIQTTFVLGAKFFIDPKLWIKGGIGWGGLTITYDDALGPVDEELAQGGAVMLGVGYEFFRNMNFAMDGNFKFTGAGYDSLDDEIYTGTFNLGFNWYL